MSNTDTQIYYRSGYSSSAREAYDLCELYAEGFSLFKYSIPGRSRHKHTYCRILHSKADKV